MLNPDKSYYKNGITINEYLILSHNEYCAAAPKKLERPQGIVILSLPNIPLKCFMSQAEYYSRQIYYNRFGGLIPHYCVDQIVAWNLLQLNYQSIDNNIVIAMCGNSSKTKLRTVDLVCKLLQDYNLGFNSIKISDNDQLFFDLFEDRINKLGLPKMEYFITAQTEEEIEDTPKAAHLDFEVYFNSQWQKPIKGQPIRAIRLIVSEGDLYYRTHLINGGWLDWVKNGEMSGSAASYIDGFQIKYIGDKKIFYRFSPLNSKFISWRVENMNVPTRKQLDDFDFKIE